MKNKLPTYSLSRNIEHESLLADLFNESLKRLLCARILSSPRSFDVRAKKKAAAFYEICLCEFYFHTYIERLIEWKKVIAEYYIEFNCNWKDYATTKRMSFVKENWGDDSDYNEDGSVKTDVGEDKLESWSVLGKLVHGSSDIVFDTKVSDFRTIFAIIRTDAEFGINEMFAAIGYDIPAYKEDTNGNMVKQTFSDRALDKAVKQYSADMIINLLTNSISNIQYIVKQIGRQNWNADNRAFIGWLDESIDRLFSCEIVEKYNKETT